MNFGSVHYPHIFFSENIDNCLRMSFQIFINATSRKIYAAKFIEKTHFRLHLQNNLTIIVMWRLFMRMIFIFFNRATWRHIYLEKKSVLHASVLFAIGSAVLYALYPPLAKILIKDCPPAYLSAFLYFGAGIGIAIVLLFLSHKEGARGTNLMRTDLSKLVAVIIFNVAASILMNTGVKLTSASNIALLGNFEIVATTLIAIFFFKEHVKWTVGTGIGVITVASLLLSIADWTNLSLSVGSILAICATICWGLENNFTRVLSERDPLQIVVVKGLGVGVGSLLVAFAMREKLPEPRVILFALLLGFVAYGISIVFYIFAQRGIGAAKTSAYYAIAPFISVILSVIIFGEHLVASFVIALILMIVGTVILTKADA